MVHGSPLFNGKPLYPNIEYNRLLPLYPMRVLKIRFVFIITPFLLYLKTVKEHDCFFREADEKSNNSSY